ncbi:MAG: DUF4126 domain-containing protein [Gammaproteobacteria bacterium]
MEIVHIIALTMGVAWASGINLYAAVLMLGLLGSSGHIVLPESLLVLTDPLVIFAAGLMYCVEFFADKTPGVDTGWDAIHAFIRIPAGAILAMGAVGETSAAIEFAAFLLGGAVATGSYATKAGSRVLINTSPEPFSNWGASVGEDAVVVAGIWTALFHPVIFLILLALFIVLMIWLLPKIWHGIRTIAARLRILCRRPPTETAALPHADNTPKQHL